MEKIITVPFAWLLSFLYDLTGNYGFAMIIFAVLVQLVLLPITAKSKKSMMKMSRLQPRILEIQPSSRRPFKPFRKKKALPWAAAAACGALYPC